MMMLPWSLGARVRVHVNEKKREDKRGYCAYEKQKKDKLHLYNDYQYDYYYYCD